MQKINLLLYKNKMAIDNNEVDECGTGRESPAFPILVHYVKYQEYILKILIQQLILIQLIIEMGKTVYYVNVVTRRERYNQKKQLNL